MGKSHRKPSQPPIISASASKDPAKRLQGRCKPTGVPHASLKHHKYQNRFQGDTQSQESSNVCKGIFSLPPEVRNYIYRLLLVQPCKFNMYHTNPCKKPPSNSDGLGGVGSPTIHSCRRCGACTHTTDDIPPRPSKWAQSSLNPFLCIYCHWERIGRKKGNLSPPIKKLRCLCSRRENLDLLMVNRQMHDEAAHIFWTKNWFAFEHHGFLIGLLSVVRPHIIALIRRITFIPEPDFLRGWMSFNDCWKYLRLCTGLQVLELDASFLSRRSCVLGIRTLHVNGTVSFMRDAQYNQWVHYQRGFPDNFLWPAHALRKESKGPFSRALADSMTGKPFKTKELKRLFDKTWYNTTRVQSRRNT